MRAPRGYTLIEAAIVLCAFLVLSSALGWLFAQRIRTEQSDSERDYMHAVRESVVSYAIRSRTAGASVDFTFAVTTSLDRLRVPQGRPYLPCPDIDGDGFEDRYAVANDLVAVDVSPVMITASFGGVRTSYQVNLAEKEGSCESNRGLLPWKTLGTKPADHWGQHYGYAVDPMLANSLFGFDETSDATGYMSLVAVRKDGASCLAADLAPTGSRERPTGTRTTASEGSYGYIAVGNKLHNTNGYLRSVPTVIGAPPIRAAFDSAADLQGAPSADDLVLAGGFRNALYVDSASDRRRVTRTGTTALGERIDVRRYCWTSYDSLSGVAFAIVSHGQNGYGGTTYNAYGNPLICRARERAIYGQWERLNSLNNVEACLVPGQGDAARDFDLLVQYSDSFQQLDFSYDDLLVWMMPAELMGAIAGAEALPEIPPVMAVDLP